MKTILLAILLTGCCALKHPLDGKAQSWCEAEPKARKLCADHGGLSEYWNPQRVICTDGADFQREHTGRYVRQQKE